MTTPAELRGLIERQPSEAVRPFLQVFPGGYCMWCRTWYRNGECRNCAALRARLAQVEEEKV